MKPIRVYDRQRKHRLLTGLDLLIIIFVSFGIAIDMTSSLTVAARYRLFIYFTIQTNTGMLILAAWGILSDRFGKIYHYLRSGATVNIVLTCMGYHFLLSVNHHPAGMDIIANLVLHYLVPILSLATFVLYLRLYSLRWWAPFGWLVYPVLYIGGSLLRGGMTGDYPYWFLDPGRSYPEGIGSMGRLGIYVLLMSVVYLTAGALICMVNNMKKDRGI